MSAPGSDTQMPAGGLTDLSGASPLQLLRSGIRVTPVLASGLIVSTIAAVIAGAGRIIAPLTVQYAIDHGLSDPDQPDAGVVVDAVSVGGAALVVAALASMFLNVRLYRRVELACEVLRAKGLDRIHSMDQATVASSRNADLMSRLTSDVDTVSTFAQTGGVVLLTNIAQMLIAAAIMLAYSWQLSLAVFAVTAIVVGAMSVLHSVIVRRFDLVRTSISHLQSAIAESVHGAAVIRSTSVSDRVQHRIDGAISDVHTSQKRVLIPLHLNTSLGEVAIASVTVLIIVGGVWLSTTVVPGELNTGELVAMVFLVTFFVRPLQLLIQMLGEAQNAAAGWRRAMEIVLTDSATVHSEGNVSPATGPIEVDVVDAHVRYGDGPVVFDGLSVRIGAGEHVAVVGETGSGKSTFAKMISRTIRMSGGSVTLSGVPLQEIADSELHGRLAIVPQHPFLFDTTVGDNIAIGVPGAGVEEARAVVDSLGLGDWLRSLPDGLSTQVGLRGELLSAGERQLVALARTALVDPDLLILDEATSGLDPATDVRVQRALVRLTRGRTTISIAHRMVTARAADRILVFDSGQIVESGTHEQLLPAGGTYSGLYRVWAAHTTPSLTSPERTSP
ncbi:ABC transporter ATP-binding protein [Williamsia soli]|uniref:ABC transporter ATP-binding protein n=1 Tax=Williamsia soli TaxID=364929 RepID=UPI001F270C8A|nr:ABC transporter ATP-binding protein [Williamsia soli]